MIFRERRESWTTVKKTEKIERYNKESIVRAEIKQLVLIFSGNRIRNYAQLTT